SQTARTSMEFPDNAPLVMADLTAAAKAPDGRYCAIDWTAGEESRSISMTPAVITKPSQIKFANANVASARKVPARKSAQAANAPVASTMGTTLPPNPE